jgi:hypothetical protein
VFTAWRAYWIIAASFELEAALENNRKFDDADKQRSRSHMPQTFFFEKLIPVLLVVMGIVTVSLILFAAGVLLGLVRF